MLILRDILSTLLGYDFIYNQQTLESVLSQACSTLESLQRKKRKYDDRKWQIFSQSDHLGLKISF